jgi:hypothetical protein
MTLASCGKDAARNTEKDYTEKRGGIYPHAEAVKAASR